MASKEFNPKDVKVLVFFIILSFALMLVQYDLYVVSYQAISRYLYSVLSRVCPAVAAYTNFLYSLMSSL